MPAMPQSDLDLAASACAAAGIAPIQAFSDPSDEAVYLNKIFEPTVQAALTFNPWTFNRVTRVLVVEATPPVDKWETIWSYPTNPVPIRVRTVRVDDRPIYYELHQNKVYTMIQSGSQETPVMEYSWRAPIGLWPPAFTVYVTSLLAQKLAAGIIGSADKTASHMKEANDMLEKIGTIESQSETTKQMPRGRMMPVRRGARFGMFMR